MRQITKRGVVGLRFIGHASSAGIQAVRRALPTAAELLPAGYRSPTFRKVRGGNLSGLEPGMHRT